MTSRQIVCCLALRSAALTYVSLGYLMWRYTVYTAELLTLHDHNYVLFAQSSEPLYLVLQTYARRIGRSDRYLEITGLSEYYCITLCIIVLATALRELNAEVV